MTPGEQTLESWFEENQDEITQMQAFSVSDMPDDPGRLALDLSCSARDGARAGFMLMDAEAFVLKAHAAATMEIRNTYPGWTSDERKILAKSDAVYLQVVRIRDTLSVIVSALKTRCYVGMNSRRSMPMPSGAYET